MQRKLFAVSGNSIPVIIALQRFGDVIALGKNPAITSRYAQNHADMRLCISGGQTICDIEALRSVLADAEICSQTAVVPPHGDYPTDISLNALIINQTVFGRTDFLSPELFSGRRAVYVRQGYAHCSCAVVSDNAVITQDEGIYRALTMCGVDALKIEPGGIVLEDSESGFIGGCSGKPDEDTIMFTGRLSMHPDGERIKLFCADHRVHITELTDKPLVDVGGIVRLK